MVTDFDTNRKPVYDFLLVNNTRLRHVPWATVSRTVCYIAQYLSNYRFLQGMPLSNNEFVLSNLQVFRHKSNRPTAEN